MNNRRFTLSLFVIVVTLNFVIFYIYSDRYGMDGRIVNYSNGQISELATQETYRPIVNPHEYRFVINPERTCVDNADMLLLIAVYTAPDHRHCRDVVRSTWGDRRNYHRTKSIVLFFVGNPTDETTFRMLRNESGEYGDIVLQDYHDSYFNLSVKAMSVLQWTVEYCSGVPYVLKTDDDSIVNVFEVSRFLRSTLNGQINGYTDRFICNVWLNMPVYRNTSTKWDVDMQEYDKPFYPEYCSGLGYVIGRNLIPKLHNASYYVPLFRFEDVYTTGFLRKYVDGQAHNIGDRYMYSADKNSSRLFDGSVYFLLMAAKDPNRIHFWNRIKKRYG